MSIWYNISRACTIYCEGPVLETIQLSHIFNDSKTFVDMPMKYEPEETLSAFNSLINPVGNLTELQTFLDDYFEPVGSDLATWIPDDFQPEPPVIHEMPDSYKYKTWAKDINNLWTILGRNITDSVLEHPERHSFLPMSHPMIVPGGRFRESYYWDTWWIMRGLLICDMNTTASYVLGNLIHDIENFGFVPNGGRIYYLDRSQPPVLSEMVLDFLEYNLQQSGRKITPYISDFASRAFNVLSREYSWWMNATTGHSIAFNLSSDVIPAWEQSALNPSNESTITVYLNRYHSNGTTPRPESFAADYENSLQNVRTAAETQAFYRNVRSGAETGWDFSSRWIAGLVNISFIATSEIIPIELNAIMYRFEGNLAKLQRLLPAEARAGIAEVNYTTLARRRYYAIQSFLWDNSSYHWRDFNLTSNSFAQRNVSVDGRSSYSTVAYWLPLWAQIYPQQSRNHPNVPHLIGKTSLETCSSLLSSLKTSGLVQAAGILTTTANTGQQWDAPNAWPPLVMLLIEGLKNLGLATISLNSTACSDALELAENITTHWLETNYIAYNTTQFMYEKYNAYEMGVGGGGGEYTPQIGFGWTNGVALILINGTFRVVSNDDDFNISDLDDDTLSPGLTAAAVIIPLFVVFGLIGVFYCHSKGYFSATSNQHIEQPLFATATVITPHVADESGNNTNINVLHTQATVIASDTAKDSPTVATVTATAV